MIDLITEHKPIKPTWHYTEDELPDEDEECFCEAEDDFFGYLTLTYSDNTFYDAECREFKVTRWARVSEIVIELNRNT